jgi:hypothetical protein
VTFRVKENDIDFESHSFAPLWLLSKLFPWFIVQGFHIFFSKILFGLFQGFILAIYYLFRQPNSWKVSIIFHSPIPLFLSCRQRSSIGFKTFGSDSTLLVFFFGRLSQIKLEACCLLGFHDCRTSWNWFQW